MYQHFPGDNFTAPWLESKGFPEKDPAHLAASIEGYKWLMNVNMTNHLGLFVDGYHIDFSKPNNVECDLRDEMVYTYNQGVILTGQRELWTVTNAPSYLDDGHKLIQSVIKATGWDLKHEEPVDDIEHLPPGQLPPWRGLGRGGIMEEQCDASGTCSQDGQTFKGIFFHHLTKFCTTLESIQIPGDTTLDVRSYQILKTAHAKACKSYVHWVRHNAKAALKTRDVHGHFGMWWGAGIFPNVEVTLDNDGIDHSAANTTDYRNQGTPEDDIWGDESKWVPGSGGLGRPDLDVDDVYHADSQQHVLGGTKEPGHFSSMKQPIGLEAGAKDPNDRGRGRRVETQIGGLALLRAYWEMAHITDLHDYHSKMGQWARQSELDR